MKNKLLIYVGLVILLIACKAEVDQEPIDNILPQAVSNPIVTNLKGGAIITYDLPDKADLLYVKAEYSLSNGQKKEIQASAYINEIEIKGYGKSIKTEVRLISVDKNRNESNPVICEIEPYDSYIFDVYTSLKATASAGGIKLNWQNPDKENVIIEVLLKNEDNEFFLIESIYSSIGIGESSVRGLSDEIQEFGIVILDTYNNQTDTLFSTLRPWKEDELDKQFWRGLPLCNLFTLSQWGGSIQVLWDEVYTSASDSYYVSGASTPEKIFFTIDLGVTAKLTRFKFWGRDQWFFNLHHPKEFEVWGTNDPLVANGDPCSWEGWELLTQGISEKHSGPDPLAYDHLTSEDKALAFAGEEYEFALDSPPVRYIRYRTVRTWTNSNQSHISELSFWGEVINNY